MIRRRWQSVCKLWRTEFLTPKDFVKRALIIWITFSVAHLLGLREFTSLLNGTTGSINMSWEMAMFLGMTYIVFYFAAVILGPILLITAGLLSVWVRFSRRA